SGPSARSCSTPWVCTSSPAPDLTKEVRMKRSMESADTAVLAYDAVGEPVALTVATRQDQQRDETEELRELSTLELVELLLTNPAHVDRLTRRADLRRLLFPRLLLIAELGYLLFGVVLVLMLNVAPPAAYPRLAELPLPPARW